MPIQSWNTTKQWDSTFASGGYFENSVAKLVSRYTMDIWHNVRMETLLTESGNTELDIVFCYGGMVFILELKRVRRIDGNYRDSRWTMYGWNSKDDDSGRYFAQNVIEQNNIHTRSLIDLYFAEFRAYPNVCSIVIVPNDCQLPLELQHDVFTVHDLDIFLNAQQKRNDIQLVARMSYLLGGDAGIKRRMDFVNKRNGLRGRQ